MQKTSKSANFAIRRFGLSLLPFSDLPFFIVTLNLLVFALLCVMLNLFQHLRGLIRPVGFKLHLRFVFTNYRLQDP